MPNIDPKQHRKLGIQIVDIWPPPMSGPLPCLMYQGATQIGGRGPGGAGGDAASVLKIYQACTA